MTKEIDLNKGWSITKSVNVSQRQIHWYAMHEILWFQWLWSFTSMTICPLTLSLFWFRPVQILNKLPWKHHFFWSDISTIWLEITFIIFEPAVVWRSSEKTDSPHPKEMKSTLADNKSHNTPTQGNPPAWLVLVQVSPALHSGGQTVQPVVWDPTHSVVSPVNGVTDGPTSYVWLPRVQRSKAVTSYRSSRGGRRNCGRA